MKNRLKALAPELSELQLTRFVRYHELLIEWNEKMNLTALTSIEDVATKHFADSLLPAKLIKPGAKCIDIGTGAGFPGVPILILREDIDLCLLDSLNKRLTFLKEVLKELGLSATLVHARAEDGARMADLRERFDVSLTRAVAPAAIALEWSVPFLKTGGTALLYKGARASDELLEAKNALFLLKAEAKIEQYDVEWGARSVIVAKKLAPTPKTYPRPAGKCSKPL